MTKQITVLMTIPLLLLTLSCAANQRALTTSNQVPAARGQVKLEKGENGNTRVRLVVEHLAAPNAVRPDATTYVVWIQPNGAEQPSNAGVLSVNADARGELETLTPASAFDVFITAEPTGMSQAPTGEPLMRTAVQ